jgi:hypothetical protein
MQLYDLINRDASGRLARTSGSYVIPDNIFNRIVDLPDAPKKLQQVFWTQFDKQHLKGDAFLLICSRLGELLVQRFPQVVSFPVVPPDSRLQDWTISQLPIDPDLKRRLGEFGIDPTASIAALSEKSIGKLRDLGMGWSWIFELSAAAGDWLVVRQVAWTLSSHPFAGEIPLSVFATWFVNELAFLDGERVSSEALDAFQGQNRWGSEVGTLEDMGAILGVTRERARQISVRLFATTQRRRWWLPENVTNLFTEILNRGWIGTGTPGLEDWTKRGLVKFIDAVGWPELAERIQELPEKWKPTPELVVAMQNCRRGLGLLDLDHFVSIAGELLEPGFEIPALLHRYPRSVISGRWALARKADEETQFENAVLNQLYMNDGLSLEELCEGLNRVITFRKYAPLPPRRIVGELIQMAGIAVKREEKFYGEGRPPQEGAKRDLYEFLKHRPGQIASKTIVTSEMNKLGANSNTIRLYCSFEPGIRALTGSGLIHAVGARWSEDERRLALLEKKSISVLSKFEFRVRPDQSILAWLRMGTGTMESGVVSVTAGFTDLLGSESCSIKCCELQQFAGQLSFSNRTQWFGFSTLFEHLRVAHDLSPGRFVSFEIVDHDLLVLGVSDGPS